VATAAVMAVGALAASRIPESRCTIFHVIVDSVSNYNLTTSNTISTWY